MATFKLNVKVLGTTADRLYYSQESSVSLDSDYLDLKDEDRVENEKFLEGLTVDRPMTYWLAGANVDGDKISEMSELRQLTFTMRENLTGPDAPDISQMTMEVTVTDYSLPGKELIVEVS